MAGRNAELWYHLRCRECQGAPTTYRGSRNRPGTITRQRLYQLVRQTKPVTDRMFEIEFLDSGAQAFAFTFG